MSFEGLQERLVALQETTTQLKELIDRLATLKFEPGSVPLTTDEENSVSGELGAEITHILRDGEEDQELLQEEVEYFRGAEHDKERLREGAEKIGKDLARYAYSELLGSSPLTRLQLSPILPKSPIVREEQPGASAEAGTRTTHPVLLAVCIRDQLPSTGGRKGPRHRPPHAPAVTAAASVEPHRG